MPLVQAGDVTGVYYIIVSGLPWQCSGQKLKDFSSNQQQDGSYIEIDHAFVYPNCTDGWVRVVGKQNFLSAFSHLDGGVLEQKLLVADGRAEKETIFLREPLAPWMDALPRPNRNDNLPYYDSFPSMACGCHSHQSNVSAGLYPGIEGWFPQPQSLPNLPPVTPTLPSSPYFQQSLPMFDGPKSVVIYPPGECFVPSVASGIIYPGGMSPEQPFFVPTVPQPPLYKYTPSFMYMESPPPTPATTSIAKTDARKIIITQLVPKTSYPQLEQLLLKHINLAMSRPTPEKSYNELHEVLIAKDSDGKLLGHAFAVFGSHQIARSVAKSLDGLNFHGQVLRAQLVREGAKPFNCNSPPMKGRLILPAPEPHRRLLPASTSSSPSSSSSSSSQSLKGDSKDTPVSIPSQTRSDSKSKRPFNNVSHAKEGKSGAFDTAKRTPALLAPRLRGSGMQGGFSRDAG